MSRIHQQISDIHAAGNIVKINGNTLESIAAKDASLFLLRRRVAKGDWYTINTIDNKSSAAQTNVWLLGALSTTFGFAAYQSATSYAEMGPSTNKNADAQSMLYHDLTVPFTLVAIGTGIAAREFFKIARNYRVKSLILSGNAKIAEDELNKRGARYQPN